MSLIAALTPILVLLISTLLLLDIITPKKTIGVIIGISGAIIVVLQNSGGGSASHSILGIVIALVSIIGYATNIVLLRQISLKYAPATMMKWVFLIAIVLLSPFAIIELPKQRIFSPEITLQPILQLGFTLLVSGTLGFILMPISLKRITATTASMYINLQPLVASTAAIIIGQDIFTLDKPLALILIVTGVFIVTQCKASRPDIRRRNLV
jgi:drug/metabolite transporter (DMT)-like permease